jgi:hypothetical protein
MSLIPFAGAVQKFNRQRGGYQIERSLRFNSADSAYLSRTPASAGNRKTWTWSAWLKRTSKIGSFEWIFCSNPSGSTTDTTKIGFNGSNYIAIFSNSGLDLATVAVFRDPSAWYHVVVKCDTTQATSSNRLAIYVNGVAQTLSGTYPTLNEDTFINLNQLHTFGRAEFPGFPEYIAEYVTEVHLIDGQALDPTSFGEFNATTGIWQPKAYEGEYGTNGFYLNFSDNSGTTSSTLGKDQAGSNDWTPNNFSVTAGAGNDSLVDSPTRYGTDTGAGGEVRGNYATLNPLGKAIDTGSLPFAKLELSNGNLALNGEYGSVIGTIGVSSGKWYWEVEAGDGIMAGVADSPRVTTSSNTPGSFSRSAAWNVYYSDPPVNTGYTVGSPSLSAATVSGDIIGVALDMDAGEVRFYKNGTVQNSGDAVISGVTGTAFPIFRGSRDGVRNVNFGQRPFAYTAPSGFKALVTTNLPEPTIADGGEYFNTVLWSGNSTDGRTITGVGFQPDFAWIKIRSSAGGHRLQDAVRGANKSLGSGATAAEDTDYVLGYVSSFTSDGFVLEEGTDADGFFINNETGETYVAWNWKAGGASVVNTDGTISSNVSVNPTAGFSIVTYAGNSTAGATIGHGLGVAPSMVIVKARDKTEDWLVYHKGVASDAETDYLQLNSTAAASDNSVVWNDTAPTSTVFTVGADSGVNGSTYNYVAYCFAPVAGYSAFGSYTGKGSADGSFVYLGFRPRYAIFKSTTTTTGWFIWDSVTNTFNVMTKYLAANVSDAEGTYTGVDFLSNGFKFRSSSAGDGFNQSGETYIYACFSENPFKYALAR